MDSTITTHTNKDNMETQEIDIVKALHPNSWVLIRDESTETYSAQIVDEELDAYEVEFNGDLCAKINTPDEYIVLRAEDLRALANMIDDAEDLYSEGEE